MMEREITRIQYNWRQTGNLTDGVGEDYDAYLLGLEGVVKITKYTPAGEPVYIGTDFYEVEFENGDIITIYNPNLIIREPSSLIRSEGHNE